MRHPLWILNSFLLILTLFILLFVAMSRQPIPAREDIEPTEEVKPIKQAALKINVKKIYEDDLFGTYKKEFEPPKEPSIVEPFPRPPKPKIAQEPKQPAPTFFDPLNVTLKGITVLSNNSTKNRAIIADNKTNVERVYKEGDTVSDAQLARILPHKIILLRSNGQQEVLYLRERDAQDDTSYQALNDWDSIITKEGDNHYTIDKHLFTQRIPSLAHFIDILDITTLYKKGASIGCRIGTVEDNAFARSLGLQKSDIILAINSIPTKSKEGRFSIYTKIKELSPGDTITVTLQRQRQEIKHTYAIQKTKTMEQREKKSVTKNISSEQLQKEKRSLLQKKHEFAPTVQEIRARERKNMMQKGKQKTN